jgi:hypothetical protein
MSGEQLLDGLIEQAWASTSTGASGDAALILLADFLACVHGARGGDAPRGWTADGTTGMAAALAARAHARDQDDVHWDTAVHPGSVVWPVVLAVGLEVGATGVEVTASARAGYQAMTGLAAVLGPAHGRSWHATATCGVMAAAVSAGVLLGLDDDERRWACAHALAMAGGVGQAVLERSGTTAFHRVAAATTGIQAARTGHARVPASDRVLDGERGVLALLAPDVGTRRVLPPPADAMAASSVRLFPVNGLSQGAVALAVALRGDRPPDVGELTVEVSDAAARATSGAVGGPWWDMRTAVASAWTTGDPFVLDASPESERLRQRVHVVGRGQAQTTRMTSRVGGCTVRGVLDAAPGTSLQDPSLHELLDRKWDLLMSAARGGGAAARTAAADVLANGPRALDLHAVLDF